MTQEREWYRSPEAEVLAEHRTSLESGMSDEQVLRKRQEFGENLIADAKRRGVWRIALAQFSDFLVLILMGAAVIAGFLGEPQDTMAIVAIIVLNAVLGFVQEYRAEKAMEALKKLSAPQAKVRRMGSVVVLPAFELVPGDVVLLEAGNLVPADLRMIETVDLQIDESTLTGESQPVQKMSAAIAQEKIPVVDQRNMAFKGTLVTAGRASGVVVRTGMATELGRIANLLREEVEVKTPLQNRLSRFAKRMALLVIGLCLVIFLIGLIRGEEPVLTFLTAVSLAVAGIPEALPAVVTVSLALGARTMSRKNALIRKLPAVEALGSVTWICADKTGTLTENRMRVRAYWMKGQFYAGPPLQELAQSEWQRLFQILALNNDVSTGSRGELQGDSTEVALVDAAREAGFEKSQVESQFPRVAEIPFSSERGRMTTVHTTPRGGLILTKGAPEKVAALCRSRDSSGERIVETLAGQGYRVLALAYREVTGNPTDLSIHEVEKDLVFLGWVGLMDPPREGVKEAVRSCTTAGIRVAMITGDHPATARAIAEKLEIIDTPGARILKGSDLERFSEEELRAQVRDTVVYARVAPEQKIRIVKALQSLGEVVAMTGDGVNDAPALKRADVGVSMGKGGTDVAREASHVILLDDNFATIVAAVREGRRIYDNIRKFVRFALSGNSGEIWTLFVAPFVGLPTPLLPIHILWVNLVTDGLPGLALAVEPQERNLMRRPPRAPRESIFARGLWEHSVWVGILTAVLTLGTMAWAFLGGSRHWQSMAFTVLTFTQMGHVLAIRSERDSLWTLGVRSNLPLFVAVLLTFVLQLCALYVPSLNRVFKTDPLTGAELLLCFAVSSLVFLAVELEKAVSRFRERSPQDRKGRFRRAVGNDRNRAVSLK